MAVPPPPPPPPCSYQRLLQTISVLEAQRTRAIMDLEALACHQKDALTDPIRFVEQLQKQVRHGTGSPNPNCW